MNFYHVNVPKVTMKSPESTAEMGVAFRLKSVERLQRRKKAIKLHGHKTMIQMFFLVTGFEVKLHKTDGITLLIIIQILDM